jgi:branched-chain amino acid transport system ATP-binding protein
MTHLGVNEIHTYYATSHILFGVSIEVNQGECVCLLGRNGVGKTTTLKSIMGLARTRQGTIRYNGKDISRMQPYQIARLGVGYIPEDRIIFPDLTTRENLEIAEKPPVSRDYPAWSVDKIYNLFPALAPLDKKPGGYLSGGEQQMLTIGRTLMGNPVLMLLDEPVEGLAPVVVKELSHQIKHLKKIGLSILFTEQNIKFATEISDRAYVIEGGKVRYQGTMQDLNSQPQVKEKYLLV